MKQFKLAGLLIILCSLFWLPSCTDPDTPPVPCGSFDCENGGTCDEDANGIFRCNCPDGFTGEDCATVVEDECANFSCPDNASCAVDTDGSLFCECDEGFIADPNGTNSCVEDACANVDCPPNSTCIDGVAGECQCDEGFVANPATNSCEPVETCTDIECPPNSTCIEDVDGDLVCECDEGFEPNPDGTNTCIPISANTREKFLGQYDGKDICREEVNEITYNITVTASNTDPAKIFIAGLGGFTGPSGADINLFGEILNDTQFRIPEQTVTFQDGTTGVFQSTTIGSYDVLEFTQDEVLAISYSVDFSDVGTLDDECEATWTKR